MNSKQREILNVAHKWPKSYVNYNGHNLEPVSIFISNSGVTGKAHFVRVVHNAISKTLLYHFKDPENLEFFLLGLTGVSAVNIVGIYFHSGLGTTP